MADRRLLGRLFPRGIAEAKSSSPPPPSASLPVPVAPLEVAVVDANETKALVVNGSEFFSPDSRFLPLYRLFGQPSSELEEVDMLTAYASIPYCFRAIEYRARRVAEPELYVAQITPDDDEDWLPDHPLAAVLDNPSPDFDMGELLFRTSVAVDTTGKALWVKDANRAGELARLSLFRGDQFDVIRTEERIYGAFKIKTARGDKTIPAERAVFFQEPNPFSWTAPLSRVDVTLGWLNLSARARATVSDLLRNALFPSVVIQTDAAWNPNDDEWLRFNEELSDHATREKKGGPLALTGGGRATPVSMRLRDLIPDEVLDRVESIVAASFGIPPVVLGFLAGLKNSPWSQMEEARRMTYEDTIEPLWVDYEKRISRQLLRAPLDAGGEPIESDPMRVVRFDRTRIRALKTDLAKQSEIVERVRFETTVNERRTILGLDPSDDWGDEPPSAPVAADPGADVEESPNGGASSSATSGKSSSRRLPIGAKAADGRSLDDVWMRFDLSTKAQEAGWRRVVLAGLREDQRDALSLFDSAAKADPDPLLARQAAESVADEIASEAAWRARVEPLIAATAETAVADMAALLGVSFDVATPGIEAFVQREAAFLIRSISETTRQGVRDAIAAGLRDGDSIPRIRERLEDDGFDGIFSAARATLIARTETTRSTNSAQRDAVASLADELGMQATKTWVATRDSRVRDSHLALDGASVGINEVFPNGRSEPGEPNCRCTLTYELSEA